MEMRSLSLGAFWRECDRVDDDKALLFNRYLTVHISVECSLK